MKTPNGFVLYEGPSLIDGAPIVVIVVGLAKASTNSKTGGMVQSYILRQDVGPIDALRTGEDKSICGGCRHRPQWHDGETYGQRSCYVNVSQGPNAVWKAYKRGAYPRVALSQVAPLTQGRNVRLGSYGDPAAVPLVYWQTLTLGAAGHTGYTHQWQSARLRGVTSLCQASVDTPEEAEKARELGLGYFRVRTAEQAALEGEVVCPASAEAGKVTTCADCRMCDGSGKAVTIIAHGIGKAAFTGEARKARALPVLS
jgi:hypothetical protein